MPIQKKTLIKTFVAIFIAVGLGSSCKSTPKPVEQKRIVEVQQKAKLKIKKSNRRNKRHSNSLEFGVQKGDEKLLERGRKARFASSLDSW